LLTVTSQDLNQRFNMAYALRVTGLKAEKRPQKTVCVKD